MTESSDLMANIALYEEGTNFEPVLTLHFPHYTRRLLRYLRPGHDSFLSYPLLFNIVLG